jgi:hypothetical protein
MKKKLSKKLKKENSYLDYARPNSMHAVLYSLDFDELFVVHEMDSSIFKGLSFCTQDIPCPDGHYRHYYRPYDLTGRWSWEDREITDIAKMIFIGFL